VLVVLLLLQRAEDVGVDDGRGQVRPHQPLHAPAPAPFGCERRLTAAGGPYLVALVLLCIGWYFFLIPGLCGLLLLCFLLTVLRLSMRRSVGVGSNEFSVFDWFCTWHVPSLPSATWRLTGRRAVAS
jgi:hypothetical protein